MERNRNDILHRTIDEQNQKLEKYQAKLRDVVTAYKELQKEKCALEDSLKAISLSRSSSHHHSESSITATSVSGRGHSRQNVEVAGVETDYDLNSSISLEVRSHEQSDDGNEMKLTASEGSEAAAGDQPTSESLQHQLVTLTTSLSTVMEQKSKMEATYLAEKRRLKQDLEDAEKRCQQERVTLQQQIHSLEVENEQWRNKLRSQQYEREKELNDHAVVIKELQKVIGDERMAKEQLENQLEDARLLLADTQRVHAGQLELYETTVRDLRREVSIAESQVRASKEKSVEPSPLLLHLQKELLDVKDAERRCVMAAQLRADEAEQMLEQLRQQSEARVAGLEAKLSELSETVGNVERLRQQDQLTIQKLRERLVQLDAENTALTQATRCVPPAPSTALDISTSDETELGSSVIVDKIQHLKDQLRTVNEKAEKPINIPDLLLSDEERADIHRRCIEQYDHLRDEFERYKLRAQSVLKNKSASSVQSKDSGPDREIAALKVQVGELRERIATLHATIEEQEAKLHEKEDGFARALAAMRDAHRAELSEREAVNRQRNAELETEMRRHRDRTISMLAERDREITVLRQQVVVDRLPMTGTGCYGIDDMSGSRMPESSEIGASSAESAPAGATVVSELIANVGVADDTKILHFAHERSRLEAESAMLRRQKYSLEAALRDARRDAALAAELHADELQQLREEVAKRDRDRSRETANLEYLKNVVHRYMTCRGGASARQQMLNAIATILQFSPAEKQQVQAVLAKGWWSSAKAT
jgi:uncharacterized small protein (DUF1192 family)